MSAPEEEDTSRRRRTEPEMEHRGRAHKREKEGERAHEEEREGDGAKGRQPAAREKLPPANDSWTEKYRPRHLREIVGNSKALEELRKWAEDWQHGHPRKKGAILAGAPGTGKTSAALALAHDMGWGVLELNASDSRNYAAIKRVAFSGAVHDTFSDDGEYISARTGGHKLIILDEADQLYESSERAGDGREMGDRGGKRAIVETVARTLQPVLLIVNDAYALTSAGGMSLKSLCELIKFDRINRNVIRAALRRICDAEGISSTPEALDELASRVHGDLRAAINDLQSLAQGTPSLRLDGLRALGERDERTKIFDAMFTILKGSSIEKAREAMRRLDETPEFVLMWLDENLPLEYKDPGDLVRGFDMLSRADIFLGRVSRRQQYSLWGYASDLMSAGVAVAKRHRYHEFNRYRFPLWLVKRSRASGGRRMEKEVLAKIGAYTHLSTYMARHQMMPLVRQLFDVDHNFAVTFTKLLNLEAEHLAFILGVDTESPRVSHLLEAAGSAEGLQKEEEEGGRRPGGPAGGAGPGGLGTAGRKGVEVGLGEFAGKEEDEAEKGNEAGTAPKDAAAEKAGKGKAAKVKGAGTGKKAEGKGAGKREEAKEEPVPAEEQEGSGGEEGSGAADGEGDEETDEESGRQKKLFDF